MKKAIVILLVFVLTAGVLAGCRANTGDETSKPSETTTPTTATTRPTSTTAPTVTVPSSGPMDSTAGDATDGDGMIGDNTGASGKGRGMF